MLRVTATAKKKTVSAEIVLPTQGEGYQMPD
jgi:hypothetical protein